MGISCEPAFRAIARLRRTNLLTSLPREVRIRTSIWRRGFEWYWLVSEKDNLPFLAMLGLLILGVVCIVCFACLRQTHIEPVRIQAMQREALRARRREIDLQCLAENIYFEARGEPLDGQYAVAEVTLNRTRAPNFPHGLLGGPRNALGPESPAPRCRLLMDAARRAVP
jgi:hypothetical protein